MQIMKILSNEKDVSEKEKIVKRCRRCINIFNSDDYYFFFANIEEETNSIFHLLQ